MKSSIKTLALSLGLGIAFAAAVPAQQTPSPAIGDSAQINRQAPRAERRARRGMQARRHRNNVGGVRRQFAALDLTDNQKEQMRTIAAQTKLATRAQREELFRIREAKMPGVKLTADQQARRRQLRGELRTARQQARTQMLAVLTTEQRTQLEERRQERERRRAERRARSGDTRQTS